MKYHYQHRCFAQPMMGGRQPARFRPVRKGQGFHTLILRSHLVLALVVLRCCLRQCGDRGRRNPWAVCPGPAALPLRAITTRSQVVAFLGFAPGCFDRVRLLVWRQRPGGEFGWGGISVRPQRRCPKQGSVRTGIARGAQGQTALLTTRSSVTILAVKAWPCDPSVPHPKCSRF